MAVPEQGALSPDDLNEIGHILSSDDELEVTDQRSQEDSRGTTDTYRVKLGDATYEITSRRTE